MKVQILSDLHLEFGQIVDFSFQKADVIIFAGDIHLGTKGLDWIKKQISKKPVIYVLGNHEYYRGAYPKTLHKIKAEAEGSNIHVLENDHIVIDGMHFHGATLWTDFQLFGGDPRYYGAYCQKLMNDYKKIRRSPSYSRLRSIDTFEIHRKSLQWLEKSLQEKRGSLNIVITHHAPSIRSVPEEYKQNSVTTAYASDLDAFIEKNKPDYWIHGHIHTPLRYQIGQTRIISNPHGYVDEKDNGFEKELIIDIN